MSENQKSGRDSKRPSYNSLNDEAFWRNLRESSGQKGQQNACCSSAPTTSSGAGVKSSKNKSRAQNREAELARAVEALEKKLEDTTTLLRKSAEARTLLRTRIQGLQAQLKVEGRLPKEQDLIALSDHPTQEEVDGIMKLLFMAKERAMRHKVLKSLEEKERAMKDAMAMGTQMPEWS